MAVLPTETVSVTAVEETAVTCELTPVPLTLAAAPLVNPVPDTLTT